MKNFDDLFGRCDKIQYNKISRITRSQAVARIADHNASQQDYLVIGDCC